MRNEARPSGYGIRRRQAFLVLCHPITTRVLSDLEMVRHRYRRRCDARHAHSANPVNPMLFRAPRYIRRLPLGFETNLNGLALILHIDGHRPMSVYMTRAPSLAERQRPYAFLITPALLRSRIFMRRSSITLALRWSVYSMAITVRKTQPSLLLTGHPGSSTRAHSRTPAISARRKLSSGIFSAVSPSRGAIKDMPGSDRKPSAGSTPRPSSSSCCRIWSRG
jgi:hypothetical protein